MSTTSSTTPAVFPPLPASPPVPILCIRRLVRKVAAVCADFPISFGLLDRWAGEEIAHRNACATDALAVDDPLERVRVRLAECLRNDPPRVRREVMGALRETHARSEALAQALAVPAEPQPARGPGNGELSGATKK